VGGGRWGGDKKSVWAQSLGRRINTKGDECGMNRYEGENLDDEAIIFCFEGEYGGERVWIV
jgi:hypothetical protein